MAKVLTVTKLESNVFIADTEAGRFHTYRRETLDVWGNPIMVIVPPLFIGKVEGFKKVRNKEHYQTQSYNFEADFKNFIESYTKAWGVSNEQ